MDQPIVPTLNQTSDRLPSRTASAELLGPTVLIADASALFRRNVETLLQQDGYRILHAESGPDAIALCAKERPDLVILEAELPGINGFTACQAMKERLGRDDLYVFLTLGQEGEEMARAAQACGGDRHFHKPIEIDPLIKTIASLLRPLPRQNSPLTLTALESGRACHVTGWRPRSRGLSLDPGPEFDWLSETLQAGIRTHVSYLAEDGARIVRDASLRQVWKNHSQKALELSYGQDLARIRASEFIHRPMPLQVKYESPQGDYASGRLVNISGGGLRLADLSDSLEPGSKVPIFLLRDSEVLFSLNGHVTGGRIQADGRYECRFSLLGMSSDTERRLSRMLFGS